MQNTDDAIRQDELGDANLFIVCTESMVQT